jgi:hypothetical protein
MNFIFSFREYFNVFTFSIGIRSSLIYGSINLLNLGFKLMYSVINSFLFFDLCLLWRKTCLNRIITFCIISPLIIPFSLSFELTVNSEYPISILMDNVFAFNKTFWVNFFGHISYKIKIISMKLTFNYSIEYNNSEIKTNCIKYQ